MYILECQETNTYDNKYFNDLRLNLKGEVLSVETPRSSNGFGIIRVKVLNSNVKNYDPRDRYRYFYCLIKDSIAELYQLSAKSCNPGDTVIVNTDKREFTLNRSNGEILKWEIILYKNDFFYNRLKRRNSSF